MSDNKNILKQLAICKRLEYILRKKQQSHDYLELAGTLDPVVKKTQNNSFQVKC